MSRAPNGLPEPHQLRSGRWRVAVQRGAGSREHRSRVFLSGSSPTEVRRKRDEWLKAQQEGRRPSDRRLSTGAYLRRWLDATIVRERTRESYQLAVEKHILPYIGGSLLSQLGPLDIDEMLVEQARRGVRPATRAYSLRVLSVALNSAVRKKRLIPYNPVDGANAVDVVRREPTLLTTDQARALLEAFKADRLGPLFTLLASTGLRRGEVLALVWPNWDRDAGLLHVEKTLLYRAGKGFERVPPKTARSARTLRLPRIAEAALRDQARRQAAERLANGRRWHDSGLIFTGAHRPGGAVSGATVVHALHRLCDLAGVPRIRPHDLRHPVATAMAERGVPEPVRMAVLGHSTPAMTGRYTHATPTSIEAADAIDALFCAAVDASVDATGQN